MNKKEYTTSIVHAATKIQELVERKKLFIKDFPGLVEQGLETEVIDCWNDLYKNEFTDPQLFQISYEEICNQQFENMCKEHDSYIDEEARSQLKKSDEGSDSPIHINFTITKSQFFDLTRTLNVAYEVGSAEYILDDGRKISIKVNK